MGQEDRLIVFESVSKFYGEVLGVNRVTLTIEPGITIKMQTDSANHSNATLCLHTGSANFVRPSVGSWVVYGLGTENQSLPGFLTIRPRRSLGSRPSRGGSAARHHLSARC